MPAYAGEAGIKHLQLRSVVGPPRTAICTNSQEIKPGMQNGKYA
jgi:hypothetical protein